MIRDVTRGHLIHATIQFDRTGNRLDIARPFADAPADDAGFFFGAYDGQ